MSSTDWMALSGDWSIDAEIRMRYRSIAASLPGRLSFAEKVIVVWLSADVVDFDAAHGVIDFPNQPIACIRDPAAIHTRIDSQLPRITGTRLGV
jgi:hypothetical protein